MPEEARFLRRFVRGLALLAVGPATAGVFSPQPPLGLYEARTILTGTDTRSRPAGLAICLEDVLVKVSGDGALRGDARVAALDPGALIVGFSYVDRFSGIPHHDDQGSSDRPFYFTARFDRDRIDAALRQLGDVPFTGPRPAVVPIVVVTNARASYVLTSDGPHPDQRDAMADAADRLATPLHLPATAELANGVALAGSLPLTGTLAWSDAAHGWIGDWSVRHDGAVHVWHTAGGSYDAAFRSAMQGALGVVAGHAP